jgi:hypothetical protein
MFIPVAWIETCLQQDAAALQLYFQHLNDMVDVPQGVVLGANDQCYFSQQQKNLEHIVTQNSVGDREC